MIVNPTRSAARVPKWVPSAPIFAYANDTRPFLDRVAAFCGDTLRRRARRFRRHGDRARRTVRQPHAHRHRDGRVSGDCQRDAS